MIDEFLNFCDQMTIAEEKLDVSILDGFGDYNMTLYHASYMKLKEILPNSWNMGNRLTPKKRKSSFWTADMRYSILWALDWVMMRVKDLPYVHDIEKFKFYVPDVTMTRRDKDGNPLENLPIEDWIYRMLREQPVYVYEVTVPNKIVSKGQYNIDEYTIDIPVKPDKMYTITEKEAKGVIEVLDDRTFVSKYNSKIGDTRKAHPNIRERLIYKNPSLVSWKRKRMYRKDYRNYGHADIQQPIAESWNQYFIE